MATVRVYLVTYRRDHLLPRALKSLLGQSLTDWVCELHNDCPENPFPAALVNRTGDPRLRLVQHEKNLGGNRTFNLAFQPCPEPFVSLLEDDNWWEPNFLQRLVQLLRENPSAQVAWSNMRVWREQLDGTWLDTGRNFWDASIYCETTWFQWPAPRSMHSPIHSDGATVIRNENLEQLIIPENAPFIAMELTRERSMRFPLLFCPEPLANFAWTLATGREQDQILSAQVSALLAVLFLKHAALGDQAIADQVNQARASPENQVCGLLVYAFLAGQFTPFARQVRASEWPRIIASFARHWRKNLAIFRARRKHPVLWRFVDQRTAQRFAEAAGLGATPPVNIN